MTHPALADGPIYLDYNATTPVDPRVVEATVPYLTHHFGNPSSNHAYAARARAAVDAARGELAGLIGGRAEEIVFTAGGSEADNLAVQGAAFAARHRGNHIITQVTEHPALLATCRYLTASGFTVTQLPVDEHGQVDPADLTAAITDQTVLVSIMTANGETGTLQRLAEIADITHERGALLHTDAAQAAGKIPLDVDQLGADLLTVAGHKLYAPKGIGALYVRAGTPIHPVIHGGGQENGLRSGTENVAFIVALGTAAALASDLLAVDSGEPAALRDLLYEELSRRLPGRVELNGHPTDRLPNTLNLSLTGARAKELLAATPQLAAATGSACHEGIDKPSPVLTAMGIAADRALAAIRLTLGRWTTPGQVRQAGDLLATSYRRLYG